MGIDVVLVQPGPRRAVRGRRAKQPTYEVLGHYLDEHERLEEAIRSASSSMLVRMRLKWGETRLHPDDMEQFVSELRALGGDPPASYVEPVVALAQRCAASPGTELHLQPD